MLFIIISFPVIGTHGQSVYIPEFDPVNRDINKLIDRGYLNDIHVTEKPWMVGNIVKAILDVRLRLDFESYILAESILDRLKAPQARIPDRLFASSNFGIELRALSRERKEGYFIYRGRYIDRGFRAELGSVYKAGGWISREGSWGVATRLVFDSDGTGYPWYYGRAHNARIVGQFDHAYGFFNIGYFEITAGRNRISWGPSPRGSLLLDNGSPPLDMAYFNFELRPFRMSWFTAKLDNFTGLSSGQTINRYLSGHRLTVKPLNRLELSASEIVLYGGINRLPELYYGIPVLLFYWEAHNHKVDDNVMWALDGSYVLSDLGRIYMQFVADDIQYESNGPQKFALQLGTHLVPSRYPRWSYLFEFNFVDTYVYGQRQRRNVYLNWDHPVGRLDSDQFEIFSGIYRRTRHNLEIGIEYIHREKGEYDAVDPPSNPVPLSTKFPSGTVEKTDDIGLTFSWNGYNKAYFDCAFGFQAIENYDHNNVLSFNQVYASVIMSYSFNTGLPLWTKYH